MNPACAGLSSIKIKVKLLEQLETGKTSGNNLLTSVKMNRYINR